MRIGYDAKRLFFNRTGLGNYARGLVTSLAQQYPQHEYLLYTPRFPGNVPFDLQKNMIALSPDGISANFPSWWRSFGLSKEIQKDHLDIYHGLSHELPYGIETSKVKSILTVHDVIFKKFPEQYSLIDRFIYDRKLAHSCHVADRIIAISEQTKMDIIAYYGIDPDKIEVIYQSCDPVFMHNPDHIKTQQVKAKYHLPDRYILYVGSLVERKNAITLLKAFELLGEKDLKLILVGDGSNYRQKVEQYVSERSLSEKVKLFTTIDKDELPVFYRHAQAFIYPSLYEGFGIPIIEALCSDVPVVTTAGGCFPEAGGPDSCYVNSQDPEALAEGIRQVLTNNSLRQHMVMEGQKYVQRFRPETIAAQVMQVYDY